MRFAVPLAIFVVLVMVLGVGLKLDPHYVPSPLINKPMPEFSLPLLEDDARKLARADLLGNGLSRSNRWRLISIGAYFAYVEHPFGSERSTKVSKRLADEENLLTIPGDMFGAGQERFIRLAFANVSDDKIPIVLERLERFGA